MKKAITAIVLAAAFAPTLVACSPKTAEERTEYTIDAALSADNVLTATVTCDYVNNNDVPLSELWFNLYPNAFREGAKNPPVSQDKLPDAYPNGRSYSVLEIKKVDVNGSEVQSAIAGVDENVLTVPLASALDPTEHAEVKIEYSVKLPNINHRFGYSGTTVNLGNFYPIACMYRDGAFVADPYCAIGDPFFSDVADYTVTFTAPSKFKGAFTGTVVSESTEGDAVTYCVEAKNVRDFAAVFGEFEKMSGVAGSTIVNYYYKSDADAERSLNTAINAIKTFSEMFGEYAYPEYTVVQTKFMHGGMEYPQLAMLSDTYSGDAYLDVIVHETAHQWWYAAVGNDEVHNAWLDEGLAEYSTMLFYDKNEGYTYTFDGKRADALSAYMLYCEAYKNNGLGDTSMTRAINEYSSDVEYSYMNYVKGAIMLDDVRNTVGDAAFFKALKTYYKDNKFGIAEPQDLVGAMEKSSKRRLNELFDSWLSGNVKLYSAH